MAVPLALVVLVVAGCGGAGGHVVAWIPQRPSVPAPPPLARPCRATDLRARLSFQPATGSLSGGVTVVNIAREPCSLLGRPSLRFSRETRVSIRARPMPTHGDDPYNRPPLSSLRALEPGQGAGFEIWWPLEWCAAAPRAILVTLPQSHSTLRLANSQTPRCDSRPSTKPALDGSIGMGVSRWVPAQVPPSLRLPLRVELVGPSHPQGMSREVVYRARAGSVLRYEIVLVNTSTRPFTFGTCPVYVEEIDRRKAYVLNCRPANTIRAGDRATFEMRIDIPASAHVGSHGLSWYLPRVANTVAAPNARVVVTGA